MVLVPVDVENAVHTQPRPPMIFRSLSSLSSASDETIMASAEAPPPRPTLDDRPPSFLRRVFAGHTPHASGHSGRKRFFPMTPVERSWSFPGSFFPGQSPQPRPKTRRKSVVSRLRSAMQWASPRPTAKRANFANREAQTAAVL
jgi:hypothetical protein